MAAFRTRWSDEPLSLPPRPNVRGPGLTIPESRDPPQQPKLPLRSPAAAPLKKRVSVLERQASLPTSDKLSDPEVGRKRSALKSMVARRAEEVVEALMMRDKLVIQRHPVHDKRAMAVERRKGQEKIEDAARDERARLREMILGWTPPLEEKRKQAAVLPTPKAHQKGHQLTSSLALFEETSIPKPPVRLSSTTNEVTRLKQVIQEKRTEEVMPRRKTEGGQRAEEREWMKARILSRGFPPLPELGYEGKERIKTRTLSRGYSPLTKEAEVPSTSPPPRSAAPPSTIETVTGLKQALQAKHVAKRKLRNEDQALAVEGAGLQKRVRLTTKESARWPLPEMKKGAAAAALPIPNEFRMMPLAEKRGSSSAVVPPVKPGCNGSQMGLPDDDQDPATSRRTSTAGERSEAASRTMIGHGPVPSPQAPTRNLRLLDSPPGFRVPQHAGPGPAPGDSPLNPRTENPLTPHPTISSQTGLASRCPNCSADLALRDRTYGLNLEYCLFCHTKRPRQVDVPSDEGSVLRR